MNNLKKNIGHETGFLENLLENSQKYGDLRLFCSISSDVAYKEFTRKQILIFSKERTLVLLGVVDMVLVVLHAHDLPRLHALARLTAGVARLPWPREPRVPVTTVTVAAVHLQHLVRVRTRVST